MKTLNFIKYLFLVVLGATLMFSCSDEEFSEENLKNGNTIETRNEEYSFDDDFEEYAECFVKLCVDIKPSNNQFFTDITTITVGNDVWTISNGIVTLPNGATTNVINNQYCFSIPVTAVTNVLVEFHGYGGIEVTGSWDGGQTFCPLYDVEWPGTFKAPINAAEELELTCDQPCPPQPECFVDICITFLEGDVTDNYTLILPTVGTVTIANGVVTVNTVNSDTTFNLPPDGTYCVTVPVFNPVTATVIYNGTGSVEINATYSNGTECTIFSAGVNSELDLHVIEEVSISCDAECPPIPDCYVNVCLDFVDSGSDFFKVTVPGVGVIQFINGIIITPNGSFPNPGGTYCIDLPVFNGGSTAQLQFFGFGSAEVTFTYPDLLECEVFSAGVGINTLVNKKMDVTLACEGDCGPEPETCTIEICANFSPASIKDIYQVELPGGGLVTIQNGIVTFPGGSMPYNGYQFCADIEIAVGTTETAILTFKGFGEVFTTIEYEDGGFCTIFSAGQGTNQAVKKQKSVTLGCDPIC